MEFQGDSSGSEKDYTVELCKNSALLTNNEKNDWIVDSGATCRKCHNMRKS